MTADEKRKGFSSRRIEAILDRLAKNLRVRRTLPTWGRLHMDRQLPFLCVYRRPVHRPDPGTDRLCVGEAAYLLAPGERGELPALQRLLRPIVELMIDRFGAFLILELWSSEIVEPLPTQSPPHAGFSIHRLPGDGLVRTVDALHHGLMSVKTSKQRADVHLRSVRRVAPQGMRSLFLHDAIEKMGAHILGLEVKPIYINPKTGEVFPMLMRSMRKQLSQVLDRTFYEFAHERTTHQPRHYHALGRRAMVKAVRDVDQRLAAVSNSFDFLYQVTPVNAERAWNQFSRDRFQRVPEFLYRPQVVDPGRMKRSLYQIPIERVEDPTLMNLFLAKQTELDRQLTMLNDLGQRSFLFGSLQLHGEVTRGLQATAGNILRRTPARSRTERQGGMLSASEFAALARREIAWYRRRSPDFSARVRVSSEMYSGLLVSRGRLLIGKDVVIPARRANALIQHEVGVHLLTYFNGRVQPFKMLYTGMPGYDELQEGLAVLLEYLVGGLSADRLRILAARVLAVHALVDGATFVDVFRSLNRTHGFSQRAAYTVTMRVFRGGGLVKDAVYLRGLIEVLQYLSEGGELEKLFIGKVAASQLGVIEELLHRRILKPTPVFPRCLQSSDARQRLAAVRNGIGVLDLVETRRRLKS